MKPVLLFLVAALAAAGFGLAVLKPAITERDELRSAIADAADREPEGLTRFREARGRLHRSLGVADTAEGAARIRTVLQGYALGPVRDVSDEELEVETDFDRLSSLLGDLEPHAGSIGFLQVRAGAEPDRCSVLLRLAGGPR